MKMIAAAARLVDWVRTPVWLCLAAGLGAVLPAHAEYRETVPVLRIGVVEAQFADVSPLKLEAVTNAFASGLGIPVEIIKLGSYAALIDAHASGRVGYAIHSTRSFAATDAVCSCVSAFRSPVAADGSTGFRSVLVVRDSVAKPVPDLRVAFSSKDSVSGWQIPQQAIRSGSLDQPQLVEAGTVASIIALYQAGEIDGFFAWLPDMPGASAADVNKVFGGWNQSVLGTSDQIRVVWSSQRIPYGPHAVHRTLPDELVAALGTFLDEMPASAPALFDIFEPVYSGFVTPDPEDYRDVRGLVDGLPDNGSAALEKP